MLGAALQTTKAPQDSVTASEDIQSQTSSPVACHIIKLGQVVLRYSYLLRGNDKNCTKQYLPRMQEGEHF